MPNILGSLLQGGVGEINRKRQQQEQLQQAIKQALAIEQIKSRIQAQQPLSELEKLLEQGKAADAQMKIYEAGGAPPSLFNQPQATNGQSNIQPGAFPGGQAPRPQVPGVTPPGAVVPPQGVVSPQQSRQGSGVSAEPKPGDVVPVKYDQFGRPTGYERVKQTAAQEKRNVEINELEGQVKNLIDLFKKARKEAGSVKGIGERGIPGRIAGQVVVGKGKLGYSPAVNVFQDKIKAFATIVAKAAGEVRPTDMDIRRFVETLPTLKKNDAENEIIMNQLVNDLRARGAKAVWSSRIGGGQRRHNQPRQVNRQNNNRQGKLMIDDQGNRAIVFPDGTFQEIK
jgi:hypothetical protein